MRRPREEEGDIYAGLKEQKLLGKSWEIYLESLLDMTLVPIGIQDGKNRGFIEVYGKRGFTEEGTGQWRYEKVREDLYLKVAVKGEGNDKWRYEQGRQNEFIMVALSIIIALKSGTPYNDFRNQICPLGDRECNERLGRLVARVAYYEIDKEFVRNEVHEI